MRRLAIFVEGHTEAVFIEKLIDEIAGQKKVLIESKRISGGKKAPRRVTTVKASLAATGQQYFVLIYDCGGDFQVKNRIAEEHENLTNCGYLKIIGMRDVRPDYSHATIASLEAMLPKKLKTKLAPVEWILAVLEIEAWFLTEATHLSRIDPQLTTAAIKNHLGFDPDTEDMSLRLQPTDDLQNCYALVGKSYSKGAAEVTISALDFTRLYAELPTRIPYLQKLCRALDDFLSTE